MDEHAVRIALVLAAKTNPRIQTVTLLYEHLKILKTRSWLSPYSADAKNHNAERDTAIAFKQEYLVQTNADVTSVQTKKTANTRTKKTNLTKSPQSWNQMIRLL
jgi:hypothetical protein